MSGLGNETLLNFDKPLVPLDFFLYRRRQPMILPIFVLVFWHA